MAVEAKMLALSAFDSRRKCDETGTAIEETRPMRTITIKTSINE
jgi:hypothetical protein